ncbi:unnamed protein product [Clonostachys byssicola]|uniref:Uncharacterized protein n=1 Tax=Clonostachys byssicola TaxID=160290 RepID=A0A9N9U8T7_9HYPO|nr:unnamed protein product [Clonostachys byssicola]
MPPIAQNSSRGKKGQALESVRSSLLIPSSLSPQAGENVSSAAVQDESHNEMLWRPFWLRGAIIGAFCVLFSACTVAISCIASYSNGHDGLNNAQKGLKHLWRFGPTVFITPISILWWRAELQTLRYWPWICLRRAKHGDKPGTNELDYTSLITPNVLITSLKRRDIFVFLVVLISVLLKVQIVLSANIFQLITMEVTEPIQVRALTSFEATNDLSNSSNAIAYFNAKAMQNFDMELPFGVSNECAYQTFELPGPGPSSRGTVESPIEVQVDGLFVDVRCEPLHNYTYQRIYNHVQSYYFSADLKFPSCETLANFDLVQMHGSQLPMPFEEVFSNATNPHLCSSLIQANTQFLYYSGLLTASQHNQSIPELNKLAAAICSSRAYISKVQVVDNGIRPNITRLPGAEEILIPSDPWQMVVELLEAAGRGLGKDIIEEQSILSGKKLNNGNETQYQSDMLQQSMSSFIGTLSPFIANYILRQDTEKDIPGSRIIKVERLQANKGICVAMAVVFGIMALISLWVVFYSKGIANVWYRDPATILGSMLYFLGNRHRDPFIYSSLSKTRRKMKAEWIKAETYSPLVVRKSSRIFFVVYTIALIAGLSATLRISWRSQGLATVTEDKNPLLWSSLPVLAFLIVAMYTTSSDATLRNLAIMSKLNIDFCSADQLDISLLDMIGLKALYHSIRLKIYSVTLSHLLATICLFLTALSTVLFTPTIIPQKTIMEFPQTSWFGTRVLEKSQETNSDTRLNLDSLILTRAFSNFTYPESTYEGLVFPSLDINNPEINWKSGISATARIPAAMLMPTCGRVPRDDYSLVSDTVNTGTDYIYGIRAIEIFNCSDGTETQLINWIDSSSKAWRDKRSYIAGILASLDNPVVKAQNCKKSQNQKPDPMISYQPFRVQTYLWGNFSVGSSNEDGGFEYISLWKCNYTWVEVMAETKLTWTDGHLAINHTDPPKIDRSSTKPWSPPFSVPQFDGNLPEGPSSPSSLGVFSQQHYINELIDRFGDQFKAIVKPYGPIAVEDFDNPDKESEILEALHFNVAMASAQLVNVEQRFNINETSNVAPKEHGELPKVKATILDPDRTRLVQNTAVTIAILIILCIVASVNIWALVSAALRRYYGTRSWLIDMEFKGVAPDDFNSIALTDALLHDSNIKEYLAEDLQLTPANKIYEDLRELSFALGWFGGYGHWEDEAELTIGVLDDEQSPFLGYRQGQK